jgi:hypothetical protein
VLIISLFSGVALQGYNTQHVTMLIFSKDRPLQLYALLESTYKHVHGDYSAQVIYFASAPQYEKAYAQVQASYGTARFVKQKKRADFKNLVLNAIFNSPGSYVFFAVDDMMVTDSFSLTGCIEAMEKIASSSFHVRMGRNIAYNYMQNKKITLPPDMKKIQRDRYAWKFTKKEGGFYYPYSLDMTLYKKSDIKQQLETLQYDSPNTLESAWHRQGALGGMGLCFSHSKAVNIPLNLVQNDFQHNRNMRAFSPEYLLKKFNQGCKIDIMNPWYKFDNQSPHVGDTMPVFIKR